MSADLPKVELESNYVTPAKRCSDILQKYCEVDVLSNSMIREISANVFELARIKQISEVEVNIISKFIQKQCDFIKQTNEFQFELIEICLTFYAASDMPTSLYKDVQMNIILRSIFKFCGDNFLKTQENNILLHKMFPIVRLCAKLIERCALPDSHLSFFVTFAVEFYFNEASSSPLQAASCSLISSIFKRYELERSQILGELFYNIERKTGKPKYLVFAKTERVQIQAFSAILFDLIQASSIYPNSSDCCNSDVIQDILNRLEELQPKYIEMFSNDVFVCLTHPQYPASVSILPYLLNLLYKHITKKSNLTRTAITAFCKGLSAVLSFREKMQSNFEIKFTPEILRVAQIEENNVEINEKFPENEKQRILAEICILSFVKQTLKLLDTDDTAIFCHVSHWSSLKNMDQNETDFLDQSWHCQIPDVVPLKFAEVERLHVAMCSRYSVFNSVLVIISRLLCGLKNTSSTIRGMALKGFDQVVAKNTNFLYHPDLVPLIQGAFVDPCGSIRDAALKLVSTYIEQNEQIKSPYFPLIIECLKDSSPSIVRQALVTMGSLAQSADQEQLNSLCHILVSKIEDEVNAVRTSAKSLLIQSLFEYSEDPFGIFVDIAKSIDIESNKWWTQFVKDCFVKYPDKVREIVQRSVISACDDPSEINSRVCLNFASVLPSCATEKHESLITAIMSAESDISITFLIQSMNYIVPHILFPAMDSFSLLLSYLESLVCTRGTSVVRVTLELIVSIVTNITPMDPIIRTMQIQYADMLLQSSAGANLDENSVLRAIFVTGVLLRLAGWVSPQGNVNKVASILGRFYMGDSPAVRHRVLAAFVDICLKDSSQLRVGRNLVGMAFKRGDDADALSFIKTLLVEEAKTDFVTAIDEIKGNSAAPLIGQYTKQIIQCFKHQQESVRSDALALVKISLSHGLINAHEVLPFVVAMLCSSECCSDAAEILKNASVSSLESALKTRISDGIDSAYEYVNTFPDKSKRTGVVELFNIIKNPMIRKDILSALATKLYSMMDNKTDMKKCHWLCEVVISLPFEYLWEPFHLCAIFQKTICKNCHNVLIEAGNAIEVACGDKKKQITLLPPTWYSCLIAMKTAHWVRRRYQVSTKKLFSGERPREDKRPVKVALIDNVDIDSIKLPQENVESLTPEILDIIAKLQSVVRHERATEEKSKPSIPDAKK